MGALQRLTRPGGQTLTVAALLLFGLASAAAYTLLQPVQFTAQTSALIRIADVRSVTDLSTGSSLAQQQAATYARLGTSDDVLAAVKADLRSTYTIADLRQMSSVDATTSTAILNFTVTGREQRNVALVANSLVKELGKRVEDTARSSASGSRLVLEPTGSAQMPATPSGPNYPLNLAVGAIAGALSGIAILGILSNQALSRSEMTLAGARRESSK